MVNDEIYSKVTRAGKPTETSLAFTSPKKIPVRFGKRVFSAIAYVGPKITKQLGWCQPAWTGIRQCRMPAMDSEQKRSSIMMELRLKKRQARSSSDISLPESSRPPPSEGRRLSAPYQCHGPDAGNQEFQYPPTPPASNRVLIDHAGCRSRCSG